MVSIEIWANSDLCTGHLLATRSRSSRTFGRQLSIDFDGADHLVGAGCLFVPDRDVFLVQVIALALGVDLERERGARCQRGVEQIVGVGSDGSPAGASRSARHVAVSLRRSQALAPEAADLVASIVMGDCPQEMGGRNRSRTDDSI